MSTIPDPRHKQSGTYPVQDRSNEEEMKRLQGQDRMANRALGGLLSEQENPERFTSVLDVGCGTGGWLIGLAKTYPNITRLTGVDISEKMLKFARAQAAAEGVADRVAFLQMDALRSLEFPDASFDLINHRSAMSWLRTWDWSALLRGYLRVSRQGGVIRATEIQSFPTGNSPALAQLSELMVQAFYQSGHFFRPSGEGIADDLRDLFSRHGIRNAQTRLYPLEYHAGTEESQSFIEDAQLLFRTFKPFLQKWMHLPDDYDAIYQRMLLEMNDPGFVGTIVMLTIWGTKE
jgi:ubiquinone/menaquinone biosynthesis C-methylase UbiE